jgi:general L-amino acid transport system permease protein
LATVENLRVSPGVNVSGRAVIEAAFDIMADHEAVLSERLLPYLRGHPDVTIIGSPAFDRSTRVPTIAFRDADDPRIRPDDACNQLLQPTLSVCFAPISEARLLPRTPFWTRKRVPALVIQVLFLAALCWVIYFLFADTMANLSRQGIASGFGFLQNRAVFDVSLSYLPFTSNSTCLRGFWFAVVNTLVLSALGIVLATILGFSLGLARVSRNWLIARLPTVYIEIFRNIPLLLQLFFWYFAILRPLPGPRESVSFCEIAFLNNRGLILPHPSIDNGGTAVIAAFLVDLIAAFVMARRAPAARGDRRRLSGLAVVAGRVGRTARDRLDRDRQQPERYHPRVARLQLRRWHRCSALEMLAALLGLGFPRDTSRPPWARSCARASQGVPKGQYEASAAMAALRLVYL